jgi:hypothetical protein
VKGVKFNVEQAVRPILKFILTPLIILSAFFQSILLKIENSENEKLYYGHTIVQVIYSLSISFSSGIVISFIINLILNYRYKSIDLKLNSLIWIPCFILVILIWIVLLNYKDVEFNLPKLILSTCGLLVEVDLKFRFWESIASVMVISGISCYFLIKILSSYTIYNIDSYSLLC